MAATLVLTRTDVARSLTLPDCMAAVERAFMAHAAGATLPPAVLGLSCDGGGFHVKAAGATLGRRYFAAKVNGNFTRNPERCGLPAIQGAIVLADASTGSPLAIMDSIEITAVRTAATTALAARHLARPGARVATIVGCGIQGRYHVRALARVLALERLYVCDADASRAERLAAEMSADAGIPVQAVSDVHAAAIDSDVCVTVTPAREPILRRRDVGAGAFVAAVGADSADKHEIDPALLTGAAVIVDHLEQCATIGELHHALAAGALTKADVRAELWQVVTKRRAGRLSDDEVIVFDSTGTALQDVAAAAAVYENALGTGRGLAIELAG